jgi:hypothetical protein
MMEKDEKFDEEALRRKRFAEDSAKINEAAKAKLEL